MSIPQKKEKLEHVYSYVLFKVNLNLGVRVKRRMSSFIWPPLFLCNTKVNLNYCVGVKEKEPKNLTEIRIEIPKLKSFNMKTNLRCYTNHIWESANVKQVRFTFRFGH